VACAQHVTGMLIPISYFGWKIGFGILALHHRCNVQPMSWCSISPRFSKADPLLSIPIYCIPTPIPLNLRYIMRIVKRLPPRTPLSNIRNPHSSQTPLSPSHPAYNSTDYYPSPHHTPKLRDPHPNIRIPYFINLTKKR
jgi:hypothetical protein